MAGQRKGSMKELAGEFLCVGVALALRVSTIVV